MSADARRTLADIPEIMWVVNMGLVSILLIVVIVFLVSRVNRRG